MQIDTAVLQKTLLEVISMNPIPTAVKGVFQDLLYKQIWLNFLQKILTPYPHGRFVAPHYSRPKVTFEGLSPAHFTPSPILYNHYN